MKLRTHKRTFTLTAWVRTKNPEAIGVILKQLAAGGSLRQMEEGFLVVTRMHGHGARELNRSLLTSLRRIERRTSIRSEWKSGETTKRFFDYVPKGSRRA
jgi:hypothetical protein